MLAECDPDHRRPGSFLLGCVVVFGVWLIFDFVRGGEVNFVCSFFETDPASALAAIGDRPVCFEDVELRRAPKIAERPADADAESRPSTAQPSILEGMRQPDDVADLHRSCGPNLPKCVS
jgi:hypothetical protein